jgi:GT2 family glycosyltransferase
VSVDVLIVTWNNRETIERCLAAIGPGCSGDVLVLDNASVDGTAELAAAAGASVERSCVNVGFAPAVNRLAERARGDHLLLLNPDCSLHAGALERLVATAAEWDDRVVVGGRLELEDGQLQIACARPFPRARHFVVSILTRRRRSWDVPDVPSEVEAVSGALMLFPATVWRELGGLDEGYPHSSEDLEICLRAQRVGIPVVFEPRAGARHVHEASVSQAPAGIDVLRWMGSVRFAAALEGRARAALLRGWLVLYSSAVIVAASFGVRRSARSVNRARLLWRWAALGTVPSLPHGPEAS